jgi:hypothetical protein
MMREGSSRIAGTGGEAGSERAIIVDRLRRTLADERALRIALHSGMDAIGTNQNIERYAGTCEARGHTLSRSSRAERAGGAERAPRWEPYLGPPIPAPMTPVRSTVLASVLLDHAIF